MTQPVGDIPTRRLAAVLLADVAGYSRLMETDDTGTHLRLREIRASIVDPAVAAHRGRAVRSKGDDLLVEFASATDAFACAVRIQQALRERNRALPPAERLSLRIGINLGDILIDGPDIAGDGVNVAARLQSLAEPGGIAISAAIREQVRHWPSARLTDAGEFRVKNISRPVRVFMVEIADLPIPWARRAASWVRRRPRTVATVVAAALASASTALLLHWPIAPPAPLQSLAVLPTQDATPDKTGDSAASSLTAVLPEVLLQTLGGTRRVAAVPAEPPPPTDAEAVGRRYDARFVVGTRVVEAGDRVRLAVTMVNAENGAQVWATTLTERRVPGEAIPVELIAKLAYGLSMETRRAEIDRTAHWDSADPDLLLLRAEHYFDSAEATAEGLEEAVRRFAEAERRGARGARAIGGQAEAYAYRANRHRDDADLRRADALSQRAIAIAPADSDAWRVRSFVLTVQGEFNAATEASDRALLLNPYSGMAHAQRAVLLTQTGRAAEAIDALDRAIRLAPTAATVGEHLHHRCRALVFLGRYAEAIDNCTRAIAFVPEWMDYVLLAAAYAMQGDAQRAAWARAELLRHDPKFTIAWFESITLPVGGAAVEQRERHLYAGLRRAGLPAR